MGLTDRSRLGCIKSRQERIQRKRERLNRNKSNSSNIDSVSKAVSVSEQDVSAQKQAWEKYMFAKAIYEETRNVEHWQYMQKCIADYEKTLNSTQASA